MSGPDSGVETTWDRPRLVGILTSVVAVAALLAGGLGYTTWRLLTDSGATATRIGKREVMATAADVPVGAIALGREHRDQVAAAPMVAAPLAAASPPPGAPGGGLDAPDADAQGRSGAGWGWPGEGMAGPIRVPVGVDLGPASVMTGFPATPEGAVGQLAQIEVTVLQAMSLPVAAEVYQAWALPGAAPVAHWPLARSIEAFLAGAGMSRVKDPAVSVSVTPVGGLIKGTDGPDWVLACVLTTVSVIYEQHRETSFGHCERMQWTGGRWLIAPGAPPASAPATWPGTDLATHAGWRTWSGPSRTGTDAGTPRQD